MTLQIQIAACLLFVASAVCAAEPVQMVEVIQTPLKSGPVARIVVALNGKPSPGAKIQIYKYEGAQGQILVLTLTCDEHGWIKTPKLGDGEYSFVAQAGEDFRASLVLDVSSRNGTMAFEMDLRPSVPQPRFDPAYLDKVPITKRLQAFRGTVFDPSGAVIPEANIRIVRRGEGNSQNTGSFVRPRTQDDKREGQGPGDRAQVRGEQQNHQNETKVVREVKSGKSGDFRAELSPGTYVAIFSSPGFKSYVVGFEIAPDGSSRLDVKLDVAPVSEEVEIAGYR